MNMNLWTCAKNSHSHSKNLIDEELIAAEWLSISESQPNSPEYK